MNIMILGIDISHWDSDKLDFKLMKSLGVEYCICKASQGNYYKDSKFIKFATAASTAGMLVGAYLYVDPDIDGTTQGNYFLDFTKPYRDLFSFAAMDIEELVDDSGGFFSSAEISNCTRDAAYTVQKQFKTPVAIYSRYYYIRDNAPDMLSWLKNYPIWLAQWPYKTAPVTNTTWNQFLPGGQFEPSSKGLLIPSCYPPNGWDFWQFTGDKFRLPGTDNSQMDVNFFNGTLDQLYAKYSKSPVISPPSVLTLEERVYNLEVEAKRSGWNIA
jgi:GH25 family lysozyme M1 (1,4-beta-N-acetylmuramidase)